MPSVNHYVYFNKNKFTKKEAVQILGDFTNFFAELKNETEDITGTMVEILNTSI